MALEPLASVAELGLRLGRDPSESQAEKLLQDASAKFRAEASGQEITRRESTARLVVKDGKLRLPQRPVVAIESVKNVEGDDISVLWDGLDELSFSTPDSWLSFEIEPIQARRYIVDIVYTHGYEVVPDDVVGVVCQMAGRALGTPADEAGITQESIGSYSHSTGSAAGSGPVGMLEEEKAIAHRYRLVGATAWLR